MKKITLLNLIFLCAFGIADAQDCNNLPLCTGWYIHTAQTVDMETDCTFEAPDFTETLLGVSCLDGIEAMLCHGGNISQYSLEQLPLEGTILPATHDVAVNFVVYLRKSSSLVDSICVFATPMDVTPPALICPDPLIDTVLLDQSCNYIRPDYTGLANSDCTGPVVIMQSVPAGTFPGAHAQEIPITVTATDGAGLTTTCEIVLVLKDQSPPNITGLPNIIVNTNGINGGDPACFAFADNEVFEGINLNETFDIAPTVQDNCNDVTVNYTITFQDNSMETGTTPIPGTIQFPLGIHTIEYCADDGGSAEPDCIEFTVNVKDGIAPTFDDCPNNTVDVFLDAMGNYNTVDLALTGTDNCTNIDENDFDYSPEMFDCDDLGSKTVIVTLNDDSFESQAATCVVNVNVRDTVNPTCITVTGSFTVELDDDGNGTLTNADRSNIEDQYNNSTESDNCPGDISVMAGDVTCDDLGTANIELTVNDNHEINDPNITICTVEVTVEDNAPPTMLECPADQTHPSDETCTAMITLPTTTAMDNCGEVTFEFSFFNGMTTITGTPGEMATFPTGQTEVTYTAMDEAGNSVECTFDITVTDGSKPNPMCVQFLPIALVGEDVTFSAEELDNMSFDPCPNTNLIFTVNGEENVTISCDDLSQFPDTIFLILTVSDGLNDSTCAASIIVQDITPPSCPAVTPEISKAPGETVSQGDLEALNPQVTDNCGTPAFQIVPHDPFGCQSSDTTVTYNVTDGAGNTLPCPLTVNIMDTEPPEINGCPPGVTEIVLDADGNATISAMQFGITAMDNCIASEDLDIVLDITELDCDMLGEQIITASVTAGGQTDECEFTINVVDVTMPTFECAADVTFEITTGGVFPLTESLIRSMLISNPSDACSDFADWDVSATPNTYDCGDIGINPVVITVEDESGNVTNMNCNFTLEGETDANIIIVDFMGGFCEGEEFTLRENSGNNVAWEWSGPGVGGGETMQDLVINSANQIHEGEFTVVVTAANGCTADTMINGPSVWSLPIADFVIAKEIVEIDENQIFTNSSEATEIGAEIASRILCYSRTSNNEDTAVLPEEGFYLESWGDEGPVVVTLKVKDSNGCTDSKDGQFDVGNICSVRLTDSNFDNNKLEVCLNGSTLNDVLFQLHFGTDDVEGEFRVYATGDNADRVTISADSVQCYDQLGICPGDCEEVEPDVDDNYDVTIEEISFDTAGTYVFVAEWNISCPAICNSSRQFTVEVIAEPVVSFELLNDTLCDGDDAFLTYVFTEGFLSGESHTIEYNINGDFNSFETTVDSGTIIIQNPDVDLYTIEILDVDNSFCSWLGSFTDDFTVYSLPVITTTQGNLVTGDDGDNVTMCIRLSEVGGQGPFEVVDLINNFEFSFDNVEQAYCISVPCQTTPLDILVTDVIGCTTSANFNISNDDCACDEEKRGELATLLEAEICLGSSALIEILDSSEVDELRSSDSILLVLYDPDVLNINEQNGLNNPIWSLGIENIEGIIEVPALVFEEMDENLIGQRLSIARLVGKPNPTDSLLIEVEGGACFAFANVFLFVIEAPTLSDVPGSICPGEDITLGFMGIVKEGNNNQQFRIDFTKWENGSPTNDELITTYGLGDDEITFTVTETNSTDSIIINSISYVGLDINCEIIVNQSILVLSQSAAQITGDFQACIGQQGSMPYSVDLPNNAENIVWTFSPTPSEVIYSADSSTVWVRWPNDAQEGQSWSVGIEYGSSGGNSCTFEDQANGTFNLVANALRELVLKGNDLSNPEVMIYPNLDDNGSVAFEHYCFGRTLKEDLFDNPSGTKLPGYDDSNVPSYNFSNLGGPADTSNWIYWVEVLPRNVAFEDFSTCTVPNVTCDTRVYANGILRIDRTNNVIPNGFLNFEVFPNPNDGEFVVKTTGAFEGSVHYELYSSLGVPVKAGIWEKLIPEQAFEMKLKEVPSGVYFIRLYDQEARLTEVQQIVIH